MKKIVFLFPFFIIVIYSCVEPKELAKEVYHTGFDFSKYSKNNFLFTPEPFVGNYESIGLLNTVIYPEVIKVDARIAGIKYNSLGDGWSAKKIDPYEAIDSMYVQALRMGADAVVRFEIKSISKPNGYKIISGIEVTGFAIKRK